MLRANRKFLILYVIFAIIVIGICYGVLFSTNISGIALAGNIANTLVYNDLTCYSGSTYYHNINLYISAQEGTKDGNIYYVKNSIYFRFERGSHHSGAGLLADGADTAGWLQFQLYNDNNVLVAQQDFYQKFYSGNIKDGKDSANVGFTNLSSGVYHLKVNTSYWRSGDWKENHNYSFGEKFIVDKNAPTIEVKTSDGSVLASGAYTNESFTVSASDSYFYKLYYKFEGESQYTGTSETVISVNKIKNQNGTYQFYAEDKVGNTSAVYTIYLDTVKPVLIGVEYDKFYKDSITVKWDSNSNLFNQTDTLTAKYSVVTTGEYPTSSENVFVSGHKFDDEGNYRISFCDSAGNERIYKFCIDKSAPVLSLGVKDGFAKNIVKATWSTTVGGVKAQKMNSDDVLTVTYAISKSATFPKVEDATNKYMLMLTGEGNYLVKISDKAGNYNVYQFTIDSTPPTLDISGLVDGLSYNGSKNGFSASWDTTVGGAKTQLTSSNDSLTVKYSMNASPIFPTDASTTYSRNTVLSADGYYLLRISDKAGNVTDVKIVVDNTAPTVSKISEYLNYAFTFTASDLHNATIHYSINGGSEQTSKAGNVSIAQDSANYGVWNFYAVDELGNKSETQAIHFYWRDDFGNFEAIKNGYKTPTWYVVTLPTKIYTTIAGGYSFRTQEDALNFAISKEWDYRVEKLENGWSYVNISNESVSQVYTSRNDLDAAILKYAKSYVSERKEMQLGNNTYSNPTDENGETREDALTQQNLIYPEFMSDYNDLQLVLIHHNFAFIQPIAGVSGNKRKTQIEYIANDFILLEKETLDVEYGLSIESILTAANAYMQGYYLVTESDKCGNIQRYVVYLDTELPTLSTVATDGSGEKTVIMFTNDYIIKNAGVMLYVSLELQTLFDNIDEFVMLCVSGRGLDDKVFVNGDELPALTFENGYYGRYTINVYDRSLNYISFNIRIAGELPYLTHTSLSNETRCTFTINYDSANNGITDVHIYKVSYLGIFDELQLDSDGTLISAATLQYIIRVGGKYVMRFTDIFGRVVETEPIFYMKGLPSGILKGVKEGGITNKDVSLEYSNDNKVYLYAYIEKEWIRYDEVLSFVEKEGYTIASIIASESTSLIYKFFLYVENDLNLFTEYKFEVDCIAPLVTVETVDGVKVIQETVTTSAFAVNWDEANVSARYYNTKDTMGQLGESVYQKNTVITKAGNYVFTVRDLVGNETIFTITLDNVVSYIIDGKYSLLDDGSYISKYDLILTVTERTAKFECTSTNSIIVANGGTMTVDGTYIFEIIDAYGNTLNLTIIIDKLPPSPNILTVSNKQLEMNGATNEDFTVSCDESNVSISLRRGSQYESYAQEILTEEGNYTFRLIDRMNNAITFTITIDRNVDYRVNGTYSVLEDGSYISRFYLSVSVREEYISFSVNSELGIQFASDEKIDVEGTYEIIIMDYIGNVATVYLIIDKTPPTPKIISEDGSEVLNGKTNKPFVVSCEERGSSIKISNSASASGSTYIGEQLSERGIYYFRVIDFIGNELVFSVEIDLNVGFIVKGVYKINKDGAYVSNTSLTIEITEEYSVFSVQTRTETLNIKPGDSITQEESYYISIIDVAGNEQNISLIIDKTAPKFTIISRSGANVSPNQIIKEGFTVNCDEDDAEIKISTNGTKYSIYDGTLCDIDSTYFFTIVDLVGNEVNFSLEIDLGIDLIVRGNFIQDGNRYSSKSGLTLEVNEELLHFDVQNANGLTFKLGELVNIEGEYQVTIVDLAGNTAVVELVIDKTAPNPMVKTVDGGVVQLNGSTCTPFIVLSEDGESITYSMSSVGKYVPYSGNIFNEEKSYYFVVTDYVGNETIFTITLDMSVSYTIKGNYELDEKDGTVISRNGIVLQVLEPYSKFTINGSVNQSVIDGARIIDEGEYTAYIEDMQGNIVEFIILIDLTAPTIIATVENGGISTKQVEINIEGAAIAYYRNTQGSIVDIDLYCVVSGNGVYTVVAKDLAGNESTYKFSIDSFVDVSIQPLIVSGQIVTESVSFNFNEQVKTKLWFNGNEIEYKSKLSDSGKYRLRAEDELGNVFEVEWLIIASMANLYDIKVPQGYKARVLNNGALVSVSDTIELNKDGHYTIELSNGDFIYSIEIIVDTVAPVVVITQEKNQVTFSKADKENVNYTLYLNGEEIKCSPNVAITARGKYTLVVTDELGNSSTYNFELNYINSFGIVIIVIVGVGIIVAIIGVLIYRKRQSVK